MTEREVTAEVPTTETETIIVCDECGDEADNPIEVYANPYLPDARPEFESVMQVTSQWEMTIEAPFRAHYCTHCADTIFGGGMGEWDVEDVVEPRKIVVKNRWESVMDPAQRLMDYIVENIVWVLLAYAIIGAVTWLIAHTILLLL
jgi:RNase P subunit RPR2